jgi:hypothetical protein
VRAVWLQMWAFGWPEPEADKFESSTDAYIPSVRLVPFPAQRKPISQAILRIKFGVKMTQETRCARVSAEWRAVMTGQGRVPGSGLLRVSMTRTVLVRVPLSDEQQKSPRLPSALVITRRPFILLAIPQAKFFITTSPLLLTTSTTKQQCKGSSLLPCWCAWG